jgi:hypothetical protein
MSIIQNSTYNGKVVTNILLKQSPPIEGFKTQFQVSIDFNDGTTLILQSESHISWEDLKKR